MTELLWHDCSYHWDLDVGLKLSSGSLTQRLSIFVWRCAASPSAEQILNANLGTLPILLHRYLDLVKGKVRPQTNFHERFYYLDQWSYISARINPEVWSGTEIRTLSLHCPSSVPPHVCIQAKGHLHIMASARVCCTQTLYGSFSIQWQPVWWLKEAFATW